MKHLTKLLTTLTLLTLLLIPASSARALGPFDDGGPVIFGGSYTLASGDTLNGDLVVFGGNVTIEPDAQVKGSIVIFGGNIKLDGTLTGDLVLIGGSGSMGGKAVIKGDLVTVGGTLNRAEGSRIEGTIQNDPTIEIPVPVIPGVPNGTQIPAVPGIPEIPSVQKPDINFNPFGSAFSVLGSAILFAALAMVLVLFLRPQMDRVVQEITHQPLIAGGVGLLTVLVFPMLLVLMVVTILLIIAVPFAVFALFLAWLFGIVSIGLEVGERFTHSVGQSWSSVLTAGFGTFLLVLIVQGIGLIPCVGWIISFLVSVIGVGGVILVLYSRVNERRAAIQAAGPTEPLPPAS